MKAFSRRLLLLIGGVLGFLVCASALAWVVDYKPYGVPDSRRDEYEGILAKWEAEDSLKEQLTGVSRPVLNAPSRTHHFGWIDPTRTSKYEFSVDNRGQEPLELKFLWSGHPSITATIAEPTVEPGESGSVLISWSPDASFTEGEPHEHSIAMATNDPLQKELVFKISGQRRVDLVAPEQVTFATCDPLDRSESNFVVCSQRWKSFEIEEISCDLENFEWYAEPFEPSSSLEAQAFSDEKSAISTWKVTCTATPVKYGNYAGSLKVTAKGDNDKTAVLDVPFSGRVRSPIAFYSPELHVTKGLDIGTVIAGEEHVFPVIVRTRGETDRKIEILDVKPDELRASLEPMSKVGSYRLMIRVTKDCPMVIFNGDHKHGYVKVGDPQDKNFSSWFPINGAIVELDKK